jgi:hypothetical protein
MHVHLVLPSASKGWILEKFALRLSENLSNWGVESDLSERPDPHADLNHWMIYHVVQGKHSTPGTFLVTHVDSIWRLQMVKRALNTADIGICLSSDTVNQLVRYGISPNRFVILPLVAIR